MSKSQELFPLFPEIGSEITEDINISKLELRTSVRIKSLKGDWYHQTHYRCFTKSVGREGPITRGDVAKTYEALIYDVTKTINFGIVDPDLEIRGHEIYKLDEDQTEEKERLRKILFIE